MKRPREEDDEDECEHIKEPSDKKTKVTEPRFFLSSVATSSLIVAEIPRSATKFIGIRNLVRPFSVPALKGYMETFGSVKTFWLNNIKSHCIVEVIVFIRSKPKTMLIFSLRQLRNHLKLCKTFMAFGGLSMVVHCQLNSYQRLVLNR
jgi:hypothetical protein